MRKYLLIVLVAQSCVTSAIAQSPDDPLPIPVLRGQLSAATSDTARVDRMLKIVDAYWYIETANPHAADTAFQYLNAVRADPATSANPWLEGWYHLEAARIFDFASWQSTHDSAVYHITRALAILQPFRLEWAKACLQAGYIYISAKDEREDSLKIVYLKKAIPIFDSAGSKMWLGSALTTLGTVLDNPKEALPVLLRAEQVSKMVPNSDQIDIYVGLSREYSELGDLQQALHYALLAVRIYESRPEPDSRGIPIYQGLGRCYRNMGDYKQAAANYGRSLDLSIRFRDTGTIYANATTLVGFDLRAGDYAAALALHRRISAAYPVQTNLERIIKAESFAKIFQSMDRLDSMQPYIHELVRLDNQLPPNDIDRGQTLQVIASYENSTGQYPVARKYARELVRVGHVLDLIVLQIGGYRELTKAASALGNYKEAMGDYQRYIRLRDSLSDVNNTKQIASLNLQYQTEKKDKDILSLNHQQQLSVIALHQASLTRNFIIGGAILLLILLAVAINRYRLKQRTNKKLELQQLEMDEQNLALRHLVKEKDWLVKEVHHRVKNNLQIVMSLLNFQSAYIENEPALNAIHESEHRVYAMSLIHQKLYNAENVASIDMSAYIRELVTYLGDSFNIGQRIRFELRIAPLELDVSQAVPLGLILNEAITNSIKYAFPEGRKGLVTIELSKAHDTNYLLCIADNGIGIPTDLSAKKPGSLGMSLMAGLAADLDGTFEIENKGGTLIKIAFAHDLDARRPDLENTLIQKQKVEMV
jgi:two-component system, sensor histidine kinase PdtaS